MKQSTLYLALDQGGHASRALVFDGRGAIVVQAFATIKTYRFQDDRVEHDAEEIVKSFAIAIEEASTRLRRAGRHHDIAAAGLATQRSSVVCWDRQTGAALSPVISWQDRRNAPLVESLRPHATRIHALTGLVLTPHYGASKLRWCLDHLPAVRSALDSGRLVFGPLSSFLLFRLLQERPLVVDPANASRTQLWNPLTGDWDTELLTMFGVPRACLPEAVESRHAFGTVEFAARRIPLTCCTGDQSAVPFAFGQPRSDTAYINMGTGAFIQRPIEQFLIAPPLLSSVLWSDAGDMRWTLEGTVNGAGSAVDWFAHQSNADPQALLNALPARTTAKLTDPLFLNGISGLGSPFWKADFASGFVGEGTTGQQFLAVLESIVFLTRANLDFIGQYPPALTGITITGGLSAADFMCQWLADLTELPVTRYTEKEATARGLAFLIAGPDRWQSIAERTFAAQSNPTLLQRFKAWSQAMLTQ